MYQKFETTPFSSFRQQYFNNLREQSCLLPALEELCGGWTQETLKSILQKLTKKNQAPLPLFFDSSQAMDSISNKKQALATVFQQFDSRGIGRIDATELFSVMLLLSTGEISQIFYNIAVIFGSDKTHHITSDEFFFFIDCLFRGISKVLICKGENKPSNLNKRLNDQDINKFIQQIFKGQQKVNKDELYASVKQSQQLFEFIEYISTSMQASMEYTRQQSLLMMKITMEVKKLMAQMLSQIDGTAKK
ncbi:unnamed protein product [Paramecium sonneborni]|uniref:EF-hand domain-containing protein n=1 Tax=Paramecium sonneborni TaxID=65129 RepID=A0A8S1JY50_9CILI|nr:unnamed protein product [Paramecium sonneborni]